jgi:glutamine synthetase
VNKIEADQPASTSVNTKEIDLPRGLIDAVELFENDQELRNLFGNSFVTTYAAIKRAEFETFMEVISPWEREFLLLNV